nr:hypothetical protein BJQ95_00226 [Cryobacterium sp. SO1]
MTVGDQGTNLSLCVSLCDGIESRTDVSSGERPHRKDIPQSSLEP